MEKFDNEALLEPIEFYKHQLKESFHNNAVEYFDELTKKGEVNIELNQDLCKKYYKELEIIKGLSKKRNGRIFWDVVLWILMIGAFVAGVVLIVLGAMKKMALGAGIGGGIGGIVAGIDYLDRRDYPEGDYELVYKVYYTPNNVKQYTIRHNRPIQVGSQDGTNYVRKYNGGIVIQTSATIETVRYVNYKKHNE